MMLSEVQRTAWMPLPGAAAETKLRVFCLPYAGGGTATFGGWQDALPPGVEVCPIQLPGRGGRLFERPFKRMGPLVEALAAALARRADKPFALFGHSMGALIAFELAHHLRRHGSMTPAHLFVSGAAAPSAGSRTSCTYDLPDGAFLARLKTLNGTPREILDDADLMQFMLPTLRADFELCETYAHRAGAPLDCAITAFGGREDAEVSRRNLEAWREHTRSRFSLEMLPGNHFFLNTSRRQLLTLLSRELAGILSEDNNCDDLACSA